MKRENLIPQHPTEKADLLQNIDIMLKELESDTFAFT